MSIRIFLIRHVESMKNMLNTYSSLDGKEPITKYGRTQAEDIANYLSQILNGQCSEDVQLLSANDTRSYATASAISQKISVPIAVSDMLSPFVDSISSGKLAPVLYSENVAFGKKVQLYCAGLLSAYNVPWPSGSTSNLEKKLNNFLDSSKLLNTPTSIIVSHKSIITCLSILLMRKYCNYPSKYYGYIDIPVGKGFLFELTRKNMDVSILDFSEKVKTTKTDVVLKDGTIVFPESSCAVCWNNRDLLLVKQLRRGKVSYELPGGKINPPEDAITAAQRELYEEAGYVGNGGKVLYSLDLDLSVSFHRTHLVSFDTISQTGLGEFNVEWFPSEKIESMIRNGIITHAPTLVSFFSRK